RWPLQHRSRADAPPQHASPAFPYTTLFRSEQGERHREDDGDRRVPALILAGQHQIDQQQRQREGVVELIADRLLLIGKGGPFVADRKSTRLNSSHQIISYAVFCLTKKSVVR